MTDRLFSSSTRFAFFFALCAFGIFPPTDTFVTFPPWIWPLAQRPVLFFFHCGGLAVPPTSPMRLSWHLPPPLSPPFCPLSDLLTGVTPQPEVFLWYQLIFFFPRCGWFVYCSLRFNLWDRPVYSSEGFSRSTFSPALIVVYTSRNC